MQSWKRYVKFKKAYHMAVTYLYQGLAAEEQRKMGERVAFYNAALTSLNEAHTIYDFANAKEEKAAVEESLTFTNDVIEGKRKAAKNENDFIYHEEVPEKESLPAVKGASLVKGISFNINDPEVSGQDIFARQLNFVFNFFFIIQFITKLRVQIRFFYFCYNFFHYSQLISFLLV